MLASLWQPRRAVCDQYFKSCPCGTREIVRSSRFAHPGSMRKGGACILAGLIPGVDQEPDVTLNQAQDNIGTRAVSQLDVDDDHIGQVLIQPCAASHDIRLITSKPAPSNVISTSIAIRGSSSSNRATGRRNPCTGPATEANTGYGSTVLIWRLISMCSVMVSTLPDRSRRVCNMDHVQENCLCSACLLFSRNVRTQAGADGLQHLDRLLQVF